MRKTRKKYFLELGKYENSNTTQFYFKVFYYLKSLLKVYKREGKKSKKQTKKKHFLPCKYCLLFVCSHNLCKIFKEGKQNKTARFLKVVFSRNCDLPATWEDVISGELQLHYKCFSLKNSVM